MKTLSFNMAFNAQCTRTVYAFLEFPKYTHCVLYQLLLAMLPVSTLDYIFKALLHKCCATSRNVLFCHIKADFNSYLVCGGDNSMQLPWQVLHCIFCTLLIALPVVELDI